MSSIPPLGKKIRQTTGKINKQQQILNFALDLGKIFEMRLRLGDKILSDQAKVSMIHKEVTSLYRSWDNLKAILDLFNSGLERFWKNFDSLDLKPIKPCVDIPAMPKKIKKDKIAEAWHKAMLAGCIAHFALKAKANQTPVYFSGKPILLENTRSGPKIIQLKLENAEKILEALLIVDERMAQYPKGVPVNIEDFFQENPNRKE